MFLDVKELAVRKLSLRKSYAPGAIDYQTSEIKQVEPLEVTATAELFDGTQIRITGELETKLELACARCLEPVSQTIKVRCQELFGYEQNGGDTGADGYSLDGDLLDLEPVLRDALVLALPLAPRCQEDCPGLCAECGVRLAQAGPGHHHGPALDPRWAALRQITMQPSPDGSPVPEIGEENGRGRP